jgi:hypothetical protein
VPACLYTSRSSTVACKQLACTAFKLPLPSHRYAITTATITTHHNQRLAACCSGHMQHCCGGGSSRGQQFKQAAAEALPVLQQGNNCLDCTCNTLYICTHSLPEALKHTHTQHICKLHRCKLLSPAQQRAVAQDSSSIAQPAGQTCCNTWQQLAPWTRTTQTRNNTNAAHQQLTGHNVQPPQSCCCLLCCLLAA